ncbi:hypothetical protein NL676_016789 [Syzygium grande]|nr:hypothetical protein NL676_016789 [Syzygium grande]
MSSPLITFLGELLASPLTYHHRKALRRGKTSPLRAKARPIFFAETRCDKRPRLAPDGRPGEVSPCRIRLSLGEARVAGSRPGASDPL